MSKRKSRVIGAAVRRKLNQMRFPQKARCPLGFDDLRRDISPLPMYGKRENVLLPSAGFGYWVSV